MTCDQAVTYLLHAVDDPRALDASARVALTAHLAACTRCQRDFEDQRVVSALVRGRPPDLPSPEFFAALAARLDAAGGWLAMADWRRWTVRLSPIAAVLVLGALFTAGAPPSPQVSPPNWESADPTSAASVLWQFDMPPDSVVETLITGRAPAGSRR